jgi:hypothetical protein
MTKTLEEIADAHGLEMVLGSAYNPEPPWSPHNNYHRSRIKRGDAPLWYDFGKVLVAKLPLSAADVDRTAYGIAQAIGWAAGAGWTVRALGSNWSFSDAMAPGKELTSQDSVMLDMRRFKLLYPSASNRFLYYVTAGCNLRNLNDALAARDLAIKTSGSSDGQTIAGALGTGVHGSAYRFGALHNAVRAYHLAVSKEHLLVCRDENALTAEQRREFAGTARVLVDRAIFDALSVSFGAFGVVLGVVMEVEPQYALRVIRKAFDSDMLPKLIGVLKSNGDLGAVDPDLRAEHASDRPHHCQLLVNPYNSASYKIVAMYKRPGFVPPKKFLWPDPFTDLGLAAVNLFWGALPHVDAGYALFVNDSFNKLEPMDAWGYRAEVFGAPAQPLPVHSIGIGMPVDRVVEALAIAHAVVQIEKFPGLGELRFVKSSQAHLAINRFAPITAVLGFDGLDNSDSWDFSALLFERLRAKLGNDLSIHWGKMTDMQDNAPVQNRAILEAMYGASLEAWQAARVALLGPSARVFENAFVRRLGLSLPATVGP